jgi:hypothetical protein
MDGILKIILGTGWAGEVQDGIHRTFHEEGLGNVLLKEGKTPLTKPMSNVLFLPGYKGVDAEDFVAFGQEPIAKVGANESSPSGDECAH